MTWKWYTFHVDHFTPVEPGATTFRVLAFTVLARDMERAYKKIAHRIPEGKRVFMWHEDKHHLSPIARPSYACSMCGGPWSGPTGHWEPELGRVWCGTCCVDMYRFLRSMLPRGLVFRSRLQAGKKTNMRFYDYNAPPPRNPPPGWEPQCVSKSPKTGERCKKPENHEGQHKGTPTLAPDGRYSVCPPWD